MPKHSTDRVGMGTILRIFMPFAAAGAALYLSWSVMAVITGFVVLGYLAEKLAARGISVRTTAVSGMTIFICVQALMTFGLPLPAPLIMVLSGFFGTAGILAYTSLTLDFPMALSGRVTTGINMLVFIAAFGVQWAIGVIINHWEVSAANTYDPAGYRVGFMALLVCQVICLIWFWIPRTDKT